MSGRAESCIHTKYITKHNLRDALTLIQLGKPVVSPALIRLLHLHLLPSRCISLKLAIPEAIPCLSDNGSFCYLHLSRKKNLTLCLLHFNVSDNH